MNIKNNLVEIIKDEDIKEYYVNFLQNTMDISKGLILEIGGGSTEIMLMDHGKMAAAHSLRLGTVLIEQSLKSLFFHCNHLHPPYGQAIL